jgi:hypothetical protein
VWVMFSFHSKSKFHSRDKRAFHILLFMKCICMPWWEEPQFILRSKSSHFSPLNCVFFWINTYFTAPKMRMSLFTECPAAINHSNIKPKIQNHNMHQPTWPSKTKFNLAVNNLIINSHTHFYNSNKF